MSLGHKVPPQAVPLMTYADVAQLAEQLICNQQVIGSSPIIGFFLLEQSRFKVLLDL